MRVLSLLVGALVVAAPSLAQAVVPFLLDGPLVDVTATNPDQFNTGGSIKIYGTTITIPENLLVQFPAAWVPFQEFALDFNSNATNTNSYRGFEVTVDGNKVGDAMIAGRVFISELVAGGGTGGIIGSVNFDGTMQIEGGPLLRINTPNGVFATPYTARPFFTADEANPSIVSFSGYPMCIPRSANDPDCPASNRPAGSRVYTPANKSAMAPFLPGDFVTWAGVQNGPNEVLCYTIVAETVQQLTSGAAGDPVYLRTDDVVVGVNDGSTNTEFATTRFSGFLSDSTSGVWVYRLDIDPCTGAEREVLVAFGTTKNGDARGKFDIRFTDLTVGTYSREYRVRSSYPEKPVAKGIVAGQYVTPIGEVVWPEVNVPGTAWPQNAFDLFGQLKDGFVMFGKQWGQLTPWPGEPVPTPAQICTGTELGGSSASAARAKKAPAAKGSPAGSVASSAAAVAAPVSSPKLKKT